MSTKAHYVTQSSIYDCPMLGPLTDRRIEKYRARGHYDGIKREERKKQRIDRQTKRKAKFDLLKHLLS
jgi:hypothetical protein